MTRVAKIDHGCKTGIDACISPNFTSRLIRQVDRNVTHVTCTQPRTPRRSYDQPLGQDRRPHDLCPPPRQVPLRNPVPGSICERPQHDPQAKMGSSRRRPRGLGRVRGLQGIVFRLWSEPRDAWLERAREIAWFEEITQCATLPEESGIIDFCVDVRAGGGSEHGIGDAAGPGRASRAYFRPQW